MNLTRTFDFLVCPTPKELGMSNGKIKDNHLWASPNWHGDNGVDKARLNGNSGWVAVAGMTASPNITVDLVTKAMITSIRTQGAFDNGTWVENFTISYLYEGQTYSHGDSKVNFARSTLMPRTDEKFFHNKFLDKI